MILEPLRRWLTARRARTEADREAAERFIARYGRDGAARLIANNPDCCSPGVMRQVRKRLYVLDTAKGADRWPGP